MSDAKRNTVSPADQLVHCTTRIVCDKGGKESSTGTAFAFKFTVGENRHLPLLITNRHVVDGFDRCQLTFSAATNNELDRTKPLVPITVTDLQQFVRYHPNDEVDLAALPLLPIIEHSHQQGTPFYFKQLYPETVPDQREYDALTPIEEIIMIGYPVGIWDAQNNQPIIRRGITATDPGLDYDGKSEFMIDAACFPGSSGSPVLLYNTGAFFDQDAGGMALGTRLKLLGVMYAGPQFTATGNIAVVPIPSATGLAAKTRVPTNLGMVIRATNILDFEAVFAAEEA